jgi:hypothetical protein
VTSTPIDIDREDACDRHPTRNPPRHEIVVRSTHSRLASAARDAHQAPFSWAPVPIKWPNGTTIRPRPGRARPSSAGGEITKSPIGVIAFAKTRLRPKAPTSALLPAEQSRSNCRGPPKAATLTTASQTGSTTARLSCAIRAARAGSQGVSDAEPPSNAIRMIVRLATLRAGVRRGRSPVRDFHGPSSQRRPSSVRRERGT